MYKVVVLGIAGPRGSGKDSVYQIINEYCLANKLDVDVYHLAFADPIRDVLYDVLNLDQQSYDRLKRTAAVELKDQQTGETITTVGGRDIVRGIGMALRNANETQFDEYVRNAVQKLWYDVNRTKPAVVVVTDVRFPSELSVIHKLYGSVIHITRPGYEYDGHITETDIGGYDYEISNDSSYDTYSENVIKVVKSIARPIVKL